MHSQTLETIPNALPNRSNPANIPDVSGMDGIPTQDVQAFKARLSLSLAAKSTTPQKQLKAGKVDSAPKKQKIEAPLEPETIQAQLAEFQKKKEQQEIQDMINHGVALPPGLTPHEALQKLGLRNPPPGSGPFAAKPIASLLPNNPANSITAASPNASVNTSGKTVADGKSDKFAVLPQSNSFPASAYPSNVVSKSVFSNDGG
jgi:hypothetical protein